MAAIETPPTYSQTPVSGAQYKRTLTIPYQGVRNSNQSNFPVLFTGTLSSLATVSNGGHVKNASGYDVIFTSDAAGTHKLNWEVERFNGTGNFAYWIQIPTLSHTQNTVIYLFYGNANVTTDQSNQKGTWDSTFSLVYHFSAAGGGLSTADSTGNGNTGVPMDAMAVAGKILGAVQSAGTTNSAIISTYPGNTPGGNSPKTLESWFQAPAGLNQEQEIAGLGGHGSTGGDFGLEVAGNYAGLEVGLDGTPVSFTPDGNWHHLAATFPAGGTTVANTSVYLDGTLRTPLAGIYPRKATINTDTYLFTIGQEPGYSFQFEFAGLVDELRMSNVARSADWIATEYNNQNNPATFVTVGAETAP